MLADFTCRLLFLPFFYPAFFPFLLPLSHTRPSFLHAFPFSILLPFLSSFLHLWISVTIYSMLEYTFEFLVLLYPSKHICAIIIRYQQPLRGVVNFHNLLKDYEICFPKYFSFKYLKNYICQAFCFSLHGKTYITFLLPERKLYHALQVMYSINRFSHSAERKQKYDKFYIR
jgi:hypothetical protein